MTMTTFGNKFYDLIYSTPSGLWVVWKDSGISYKLSNYAIRFLALNMTNNTTMMHMLDGDSFSVPGRNEYSMNLDIVIGEVEQQPIKRFSDIFTVEDLKKISKITTQKFRRM